MQNGENRKDDSAFTSISTGETDGDNLYRQLVESSPDLIWQCDLKGRYIFLNAACEKIFGYPREEMLGKHFTAFMSEPQAQKDMETFALILASGSVRDYETVHLHRSGREIHLSFNASYVRDAQGRVLGTRGIAKDISARKQAEKDLADSRQRYREMVMHSPMGMHFYDLADGKLIFSDFNPAADRLLGVSNAQFVGKTIEEAFPPLAQTEVPTRYIDAAADGVPWSTEQVVYADDQITGAFEVHAFQIAPMKMVAVFLEITDRKRAEEALRNEKERISVTLRSIGDGVIATDIHGNITLMNKIAEALTGWSFREALGRPLKEVFQIINEVNRGPVENPVERVLKTRTIVEIANHTVLISKNGSESQIADSGAPIFDEQSRIVGVVLVFRDVTEKTRMSEAMQRTQKLESLGILAGGIAHDFNNLLGGIFGYLDLARARAENPLTRQYMEKAFFIMERARGLTEQLMTFSKGGQPVLRTVEPASLIERSAKFMLSGTNVSIGFDFAPDLFRCRVDENQFGQVIDNLVINAQQAMPRGGRITITARNEHLRHGEHPGLAAGEYVRIVVADTGMGILREILPNIFDPFFTTKKEGSGLGLATCHSIVRKHDGSLDVTSEPGRGSRFIIRLPAVVENAEETQESKRVSRNAGGGRILIMDDEDYIREVLQTMLESLGYEVVATGHGEEAIEAVNAHLHGEEFTAVILDLTVPGAMGGKDAARIISEMAPNLPIFVSSGYSDDPVIATPSTYGFLGSIIKPYRRSDVEAMLKTLKLAEIRF